MKILQRIIILALTSIMLASCASVNDVVAKGGAPEGENESGIRLVAEVIEIEDGILVNVTESEYVAGVYRLIITPTTEIRDSQGHEIATDTIKVGDLIEAVISLQTMMSYPPQAVVFSIKIL